MGVFTYSPELGTFAESMGDPVPQEEKESRLERLMALQSELASAKNRINRETVGCIGGRR